LQVQDGRDHAFAGEAVERPEQHAIELALVGILEQRSELLAALGALPAAFMVNVLVHELVASAGTPLPQLPQLVLLFAVSFHHVVRPLGDRTELDPLTHARLQNG